MASNERPASIKLNLGGKTYLTEEEWARLPEYSYTVPTGVVIGKTWKRHEPYLRKCNSEYTCGHWLICQYGLDGNETAIIYSSPLSTTVEKPVVAARAPQKWTPEED